jgi:hypothetical protein
MTLSSILITFRFLLDQKAEKKSSSLEALLFEHRFKKQANRSMLIPSLFVRYASKRTNVIQKILTLKL